MEQKSSLKVIAVMPAYNAEETLEKTYRDIPTGAVDEVILVDDASKDNTVEIARRLGLTVIVHEQNKGYGGNQKTCYKQALERGADVIVMVHPDYQYDSRLVLYLIQPVKDDLYDVMLGTRIRTRREALAGGMPLYKYLANRFLTLVENVVLGQNLSEFHTGYRVFSRRVLETIPYELNSNDFVFDSQMLVQAAAMNFRIGEFPVPVRYFEGASSINFRRSMKYGFGTLFAVCHYIMQKWHIKKYEYLTPKSNVQYR